MEDQKVCQSSVVLTVYLEEIYEKLPWGCLLFWQFAGKVSVSPTAFWILVDDSKHYPMDFSHLTPTQMLRTLTEQAGMSVTELGKLLGSKGAASELLSGKRERTKQNADCEIVCAIQGGRSSIFAAGQSTGTCSVAAPHLRV